jgi:hypothetical protein
MEKGDFGSETFCRIQIRILKKSFRIRAAPVPNEFEVKLLWALIKFDNFSTNILNLKI